MVCNKPPEDDEPTVMEQRMPVGDSAKPQHNAASVMLVQVHQSQLETVLPKPGGSVMVLSGAHAGAHATLLAIDEKKFQVQVRVLSAAY